MKFLPSYKKALIFISVLIWIFFIFLIYKFNLNLYFKFIFIFCLLTLAISLLTIFELVNSWSENFFFWAGISLFISYFLSIFAGAIFFFLILLKFFNQKILLNNSLKIPFAKLVSQNVFFIFLAIFLILISNSYQSLINKQDLPFSFGNFQKFIEKTQIVLNFFNLNFNPKEKVQNLFSKFLENYNLSSQARNILIAFLPAEPLEIFLYNSLKISWENFLIRKIYLAIFFLFLFLIYYIFLKIISLSIGLISLIFYNLFLRSGIVKINTYSLTREVLEL